MMSSIMLKSGSKLQLSCIKHEFSKLVKIGYFVDTIMLIINILNCLIVSDKVDIRHQLRFVV